MKSSSIDVPVRVTIDRESRLSIRRERVKDVIALWCANAVGMMILLWCLLLTVALMVALVAG